MNDGGIRTEADFHAAALANGFGPKDIARFVAKVEFAEDGCWEWQAARDKDGYGVFSFGRNRRSVRAHRTSFEMAVGPIRQGLHVLHACDNPSCVNPQHVYPGTNLENVRDRQARNRQARGPLHSKRIRAKAHRGERHHRARLRREDVIRIRARCAAGESTTTLAKAFHVTQATISDIATGHTWRHVGGPIRRPMSRTECGKRAHTPSQKHT